MGERKWLRKRRKKSTIARSAKGKERWNGARYTSRGLVGNAVVLTGSGWRRNGKRSIPSWITEMRKKKTYTVTMTVEDVGEEEVAYIQILGPHDKLWASLRYEEGHGVCRQTVDFGLAFQKRMEVFFRGDRK